MAQVGIEIDDSVRQVIVHDSLLRSAPQLCAYRGVPASRVRTLFPEGCMYSKRVTLAPPISRRVAAVHPSLYTLFNAVPWLRTHMVAWIIKP